MTPAAIRLSLFGLFCSLYMLTMGGHGYGGVGTTTYDVTRSIALDGDVAIAPVPWGQFGPDGRFYAQYGIGHSLYNLPWYLIGHGLARLVPRLASQYDRLTMFTTLLGQPFISACTVLLLWRFCRNLGYAPRTALWCAILYGAGTQAWMYAQLDFSEPLLTFWLLAAWYWLHGIAALPARRADRCLMLAGACVGVAIMTKIVAVIVLPLALLYLWLLPVRTARCRARRIGILGGVVGLTGLLPMGWYNWIRFGNLLQTGYGNEFTRYWKDILRHFAENLIGLEGSIVLYSPVILLALWGLRSFWKRDRAFATLVFGSILAFFLFYPFTTNELYYGPRYLTPTLPLFLLVAGAGFPAERRSRPAADRFRFWKPVMAALLLLGIGQQLVGVLVNYHTYYWRIQYTLPAADAAIQNSPAGRILLSTPQVPHLVGHLWLLGRGIQDFVTPGGLPIGGVMLLSDGTQHNAWVPFYGLDVWWLHPALTRMLHWPGVLALASALLALIGLSAAVVVKHGLSSR